MTCEIRLAHELLSELRRRGWDVQDFENALSAVSRFLEECPEWRRLLDDARRNGLKWANRKFQALTRKILLWCENNKERLLKILKEEVDSKYGTAKTAAKYAGREAISYGAKNAVKKVATTTTVTTTTKYFFGLYSRATTTQVVKAVTISSTRCLKAASPIGIVSDIVQLGLETNGHKNAGKVVGASGNMISGAMMGFALGGPVGAGIGLAAGLGVWKGGEVVGNIVGNAMEWAFSR